MQVKCGTDIIEIDRIKKDISKFGDKFLNRIYTENEIKYCENKGMEKYQSYAARFAAKEAIFKAISEKLESNYSIEWKNMEILNCKNGRPQVIIHNQEQLKIKSLDISLSHCRDYAISTVVVVLE